MPHRVPLQGLCLSWLLILPLYGHGEVTANVGITSNYVFRGFTQTNDNAALQGGIDYKSMKGFFAGGWVSQVDCNTFNPCFNNPGVNADGLELDAYAGYGLEFENDFGFEVGYAVYEYDNSALDANRELFAGISYRGASLTYYNGEDTTANEPDYEYLDFKFTLPLPEKIDLKLHYGRFENDNNTTINDYGATLSKKVLDLDISLSLTSEDETNKEEFFVTVTYVFNVTGRSQR